MEHNCMKCIVGDFKESLCDDGYCERFYGKTGNFIDLIPRWIPVTARCPEIGQIVLCLLKTRHYYGRIHVCKYCAADKYYDHPYFDWGHNGFPDVVAWMPLPEPYKDGDTDGCLMRRKDT